MMWTLGILGALGLMGAAYVSPHVGRWRAVRRMGRWCAERHALALTYDDGPGPALTARVLDVLKARGARATFFLLGSRAGDSPQMADRVSAEGHEAGCHTHDHLNAWKTWPWKARRDVARGYETLMTWVGANGLFRPPYGKMTLLTAAEVWMRGARVGWWTLDSGDTWDTAPSVESTIERVRRAGGGVVLLHDFDRVGAGAEARAEFVMGVTTGLLELAEEEGWRVVTLGEVMEGAGLA